MSEQNPSAAETIQAINDQLRAKKAAAYSLKQQLDSLEDEIKALTNTLNGANLGAQFERDRAAEPNKEPATEE